jgi:hypothetical protein
MVVNEERHEKTYKMLKDEVYKSLLKLLNGVDVKIWD